MWLFAVDNQLVYSRTCYPKPVNEPMEQCFNAEPLSWVKNLNCELCNTDGCNGAKNTTKDAPSNMSTNGPSNAPTNAPNNGPTNAPHNDATNAPSNGNTDSKDGSSDAMQFGPIALLCIIPVAVARSILV